MHTQRTKYLIPTHHTKDTVQAPDHTRYLIPAHNTKYLIPVHYSQQPDVHTAHQMPDNNYASINYYLLKILQWHAKGQGNTTISQAMAK